MAKRQVFYSFHYANDCWRVQMVRNMFKLDGNPPASANEWEEVKRKGSYAIANWIRNAMRYRTCLVVLYGAETYLRPWVQFEIEHAWNEGKGVVAIAIDRLENQYGQQSTKGQNPLTQFVLNPYTGKIRKDNVISQWGEKKLNEICHSFETVYKSSEYAYNDIRENLEWLIEKAIEIRNQYPKP